VHYTKIWAMFKFQYHRPNLSDPTPQMWQINCFANSKQGGVALSVISKQLYRPMTMDYAGEK